MKTDIQRPQVKTVFLKSKHSRQGLLYQTRQKIHLQEDKDLSQYQIEPNLEI